MQSFETRRHGWLHFIRVLPPPSRLSKVQTVETIGVEDAILSPWFVCIAIVTLQSPYDMLVLHMSWLASVLARIESLLRERKSTRHRHLAHPAVYRMQWHLAIYYFHVTESPSME